MTHSSRVWSWFFQRISALYLLVGMIVHFSVLHFFKGDMPVNFNMVAERLSSPCWVIFDISLLLTAVWHGWNGCWQILMDVNPAKTQRTILGWLFVLSGIAAVGIGIAILIPMSRG